jgi:hypothetical protein
MSAAAAASPTFGELVAAEADSSNSISSRSSQFNNNGLTWEGAIPAIVSLASSDVTSLNPPLPVFVLLPRVSYLIIALAGAIDSFKEHAAHQREGEAVKEVWFSCWEGHRDGIPLRYHFPIGVVYDLMNIKLAAQVAEERAMKIMMAETSISPVKKQQQREGDGSNYNGDDDDTASAAARGLLPWKITVHFSNFPSATLIPFANDLSPMDSDERFFSQALKQSLFLAHGNSKVSMGMSKASAEQLWSGLVDGNHVVYYEVAKKLLPNDDGGVSVPVRVLQEGKALLVKRIAWDRSITLQDLLNTWNVNQQQQSSQVCQRVLINGIEPPLNASLVELWEHLHHPDFFLYLSCT